MTTVTLISEAVGEMRMEIELSKEGIGEDLVGHGGLFAAPAIRAAHEDPGSGLNRAAGCDEMTGWRLEATARDGAGMPAMSEQHRAV